MHFKFCCNDQTKQSLEWREWRLDKKLGFGAVLPKPLLCREQAAAELERGHGGLQAVLSFASHLRQTHHVVFYECSPTIISEAQASPWKHPQKQGAVEPKIWYPMWFWPMKKLQVLSHHSVCQ